MGKRKDTGLQGLTIMLTSHLRWHYMQQLSCVTSPSFSSSSVIYDLQSSVSETGRECEINTM